jgi:lipoprotein-anchoring transpeptidase ErfK/SrfK
MLNRRNVLLTLGGLLIPGPHLNGSALASGADKRQKLSFDPALLPPPESPVDFPIERVDPRIVRKKFRRQEVSFRGDAPPRSIVVDPRRRFLFYVLDDHRAVRYGVGVGRAGFAWSGSAIVGMKRRWPRWVPPRSMVERDANARRWVNGQPGGSDNPLGARALYLFANGADTLYRIHGTNDPRSIGRAVSSGCIRLLNEDIAELYELVKIGTKVRVL